MNIDAKVTKAYNPVKTIGAGILYTILTATGCHKNDKDEAVPAPAPKANIVVQDQSVNGTTYGASQSLPLATSTRHNTIASFIPQQTYQNAAIEARLYNPEGYIDSCTQFGPISLNQSTGVTIPNSFLLSHKQSASETSELEYHLVENMGTPNEKTTPIENTKLTVVPDTANQPNYDSERRVGEAVKIMDLRYKGSDRAPANANPGLAVVYSDTPSATVGAAATDLQTAWQNRVSQYVQNAMVNLVPASQATGKKMRILVGLESNVQEISDIVNALSVTVDKAKLISIETPDYFGIVATGTSPDEVALAAEALQAPYMFNLKESNVYSVEGTSGNLTVTKE